MIQNYGYHPLNKEPYGVFFDHVNLFVSCCGFDIFNKQFFYQSRPKGRSDYYFLYVSKGYILIHLDRVITLKQGECIIIPPHQQHAIQYPNLDEVKVYWLHFSGSDAKSYYATFESNILPMQHTSVFILDEVIRELQYQDLDFEKMTAQLIIRLFTLIKRQKNAIKKDPLIQDLLLYMHLHMKNIASLDTMATYVNLSPSRLSHRFQEVMSVSPMNYLIQLRMTTAHRLLLSTDLSMKEISEQIGYSNSLYFSGQFKKHYKLSPSEYRRKHHD